MFPALTCAALAACPVAQASGRAASSSSSRALTPVPLPGSRFAAGASAAAAARPQPRRRAGLVVRALGGEPYYPFPWHEDDYYRVGLQMVQMQPPGSGPSTGYFLLMRQAENETLEDPDRALVMSVGGDTLSGVAQLVQGLQTGATGGRPMSLDLLWQVLQRGQEISRRTWTVLRVAVVELRGNTFMGRAWFGDAVTGQVAWDCDCRPSDACWLALKANAPIFIHRTVWEDSAMLLREIQRASEGRGAHQEAALQQREQNQDPARMGGQMEVAGWRHEDGEVSVSVALTTPRAADPEPLKRLKMEMRVALAEEDYATATRIRDHPFMRLHLAGLRAAQIGDLTEADRCEQQLRAAIQRSQAEEEWQQRQGRPGDGRSFY